MTRTTHRRIGCLTALLTTGFWLAASPNVTAQIRSGGGQSDRKPGARGGVGGPIAAAGTGTAADTAYCRIVRYTPSDLGEWDDFHGNLLVKPVAFGSHVERLYLVKERPPRIDVDADLPEEDLYLELFDPGLYCTVQWSKQRIPEDARRPTKVLLRIEFTPIEVDGTILSIQEDEIKVRVHPASGTPWPHVLAREKPGADTQSDRAKARLSRPLVARLAWMPDVSEWMDEYGDPCNSWDYNEGEPIRASIIVGVSQGLILSMSRVPPDESP